MKVEAEAVQLSLRGNGHSVRSRRFSVEREYVATVEVPSDGDEPGDALVKALKAGVQTADGVYHADVVQISGRDVTVIVREGKHRMVRRWDSLRCHVEFPQVEVEVEVPSISFVSPVSNLHTQQNA